MRRAHAAVEIAERLQDPWAPRINTCGECRAPVLVHHAVEVGLILP